MQNLLPHTHIWLVLAWALFCFLHSVLASDAVKHALAPRLPGGGMLYRRWYNLFAATSLAALLLYQFSLPRIWLYRPAAWLIPLFAVTAAAGITVMGICIARYFGPLSGLGKRHRNITAPVLLQDGLHRYMRHPLYTGTLVCIWSLFALFPWLSLALSNSIITAYTLAGARLEEKKLLRQFGEAYKAYREKVPMFIPGRKKAVS